VTTGSVHDAKVMHHLIREDDRAVYGDKGYASDAKKRAAEEAGVLWAVKEKAKPGRKLSKRQQARNRRFGKVRASIKSCYSEVPWQSSPARVGAEMLMRALRCLGKIYCWSRAQLIGKYPAMRLAQAQARRPPCSPSFSSASFGVATSSS